MNNLGAGLIDTGIGVVQSIGQALYQDYWMDENYRRQRQLRDEQWEHDSPSAQMKRFKDAGLNPNLIYGQMSNSASAPAAADAPNVPYAHASNLQAAVNADKVQELRDAEVDTQQALAEKYRSEQRLNDTNIGLSASKKAYYDRLRISQDVVDDYRRSGIKLNEQYVDESMQRVQNLIASKDAIEASTRLTTAQAVKQEIDNKWEEKLKSAQYKQALADIAKTESERKRIEQVIQQSAESFSYELAILMNRKDISDAEKEVAAVKKTQALYEKMKVNALIDDQGNSTTIGRVYGALQLTLDLVGSVFHFTGFQNFTPKEKSSMSSTFDEDGVLTGGTHTTHSY